MTITAAALRSMDVGAKTAYLDSLTEKEAVVLLNDWDFWARPEQQIPPEFRMTGSKPTWLILAGRGFGKTKTGASTINKEVEAGNIGRLGLIAETAADARDVIVEGESGILASSPPWFRPVYEPSKRRLSWPNGAVATMYNATEPDQLRGPQHDFIWGDELAKWQYAQETFDQAMFGLRLGKRPRSMFTTTPRPIKLIRELVNDPTVHVTRGRTLDNMDNLPESFIHHIQRKYEGTRLGRQELDAEILMDMPGALWTRELLERAYMKVPDGGIPLDIFSRIVVAIDPAVSNNEGSDETGIIAAGVRSSDQHMIVLEDASGRYSPIQWATKAIELYKKYHADRIIAEVNNGGDLVENTIRMVDANVPYKAVRASKGKIARAEPISALYERNLVHHCGSFAILEDQMSQLTSDFDKRIMGFSPDRVDALVWAGHELKISAGDGTAIIDFYRQKVASKLKTIGATP